MIKRTHNVEIHCCWDTHTSLNLNLQLTHLINILLKCYTNTTPRSILLSGWTLNVRMTDKTGNLISKYTLTLEIKQLPKNAIHKKSIKHKTVQTRIQMLATSDIFPTTFISSSFFHHLPLKKFPNKLSRWMTLNYVISYFVIKFCSLTLNLHNTPLTQLAFIYREQGSEFNLRKWQGHYTFILCVW